MEEKRKGLILSDPRERYMELDNSYWLRNLSRAACYNKIGKYSDLEFDNRDLIKPEINYCMVVSARENGNYNLYFVTNRDKNVVEVMPVIRTNKKVSRIKYEAVRKLFDYVTDYVKFDEIKKIDVDGTFNIEYYLTLDDYSSIMKLYKKSLRQTVEPETRSKYEFGDILSLQNTSEKLIFICARDGLVYTCHIYSDDMFTGFKRITNNNIIGKYDELSDLRKQKLLSKLERALELSDVIPKRVKDPLKTLVSKNKQ